MRRRVASGQEPSIRGPGFHRVNDLDLTVIPQQHDDFQKSACRVQPDPQFALRVLVIQGSACQRRPRGSDRVLVVDPVFVRGRGVDHARAHSLTAARTRRSGPGPHGWRVPSARPAPRRRIVSVPPGMRFPPAVDAPNASAAPRRHSLLQPHPPTPVPERPRPRVPESSVYPR